MALTGFLVNQGHTTICAADSASAMVAIGGRFPYVAGNQPVLCSLDSSTFTVPATFNNAITCHSLVATSQYTFTHPMVLARCDPADTLGTNTAFYADGMQMGWGVVSAMAAALAIIFIKKSFFR